MTIRNGFQTFDFQHALELPKPLTFANPQDALTWLKHLWSQHPHLISRFREYVARYTSDPESFRLSDYQTIERLAALLHSRKIVVVSRESRAGGGNPSPRRETLPPPFPLSERKKRAATQDLKWTTQKTWIAIELRDSDGIPVAGETYQIELPNGRMIEGSLDQMGMARVSEIDPGQCKVTFPRLDGSTWALRGASAS